LSPQIAGFYRFLGKFKPDIHRTNVRFLLVGQTADNKPYQAGMTKMPEGIPTLVTVADLARAFDVSESILRRILRQRGIRPTAMAANVGVFDREGVARVRHAVNAYQAGKAQAAAEAGKEAS